MVDLTTELRTRKAILVQLRGGTTDWISYGNREVSGVFVECWSRTTKLGVSQLEIRLHTGKLVVWRMPITRANAIAIDMALPW